MLDYKSIPKIHVYEYVFPEYIEIVKIALIFQIIFLQKVLLR